MKKMADRGVIIALCLLELMEKGGESAPVWALLVAVIASSLHTCLDKRKGGLVLVTEGILMFFFKPLISFLPLLLYDMLWMDWSYIPIFFLVPMGGLAFSDEPTEWVKVFLLLFIAWWLCRRTRKEETLKREAYEFQDKSREETFLLSRKNKELLEKQGYDVQLATLQERNRIAREIHDNVGHLLTRAILQTGALEVVYGKQEGMAEALKEVKGTLNEAMENIRSSVHDLHEEAFDLEIQLRMLIEQFSFCPVRLSFDAGRMPKDLNYCLLAIAKEGLSNIARHSNATEARIVVMEHPALYQMTLEDNGTGNQKVDRAGMGLRNMEERVQALGGIFRAEWKNGFHIFLSVPKERSEENDQFGDRL